MMNNTSTRKLVLAAMFAALTCAATMSIRIPIYGTQGYIHPGDALVILCGIFLDPASALLAAGIGSALADMLGGYFIYVPITFVIKGLVAYCGSRFFHGRPGTSLHPQAAVACCGLIDVVFVALGYCVCEIFLYGLAAALASVPSNIIQGVSGLVIAFILYPLLQKMPQAA